MADQRGESDGTGRPGESGGGRKRLWGGLLLAGFIGLGIFVGIVLEQMYRKQATASGDGSEVTPAPAVAPTRPPTRKPRLDYSKGGGDQAKPSELGPGYTPADQVEEPPPPEPTPPDIIEEPPDPLRTPPTRHNPGGVNGTRPPRPIPGITK